MQKRGLSRLFISCGFCGKSDCKGNFPSMHSYESNASTVQIPIGNAILHFSYKDPVNQRGPYFTGKSQEAQTNTPFVASTYCGAEETHGSSQQRACRARAPLPRFRTEENTETWNRFGLRIKNKKYWNYDFLESLYLYHYRVHLVSHRATRERLSKNTSLSRLPHRRRRKLST